MLRHLTGASLLALALATTPALAQDSSALDTLVPEETAIPAAPAKTGDAVLDRLNELEAKVARLEARNKELEDKAAATQERVEKVEVRAARGVQPGPAPTFADVNGNFTFKPRGTFQIDYAGYDERAGGYDYNNGTDVRRARFGFDGTAFKAFRWRLEAEYVKNTVNLLDAYVQYVASPKWSLTVGQHKAPFGLEANTSDAFNTFLERGMANNAFGAIGAERRVGVSLAYQTDQINAAIGLFGAGEAIVRNATSPDESYGVNARITWDPILDTGRLLHLGVSGYRVTNFQDNVTTSTKVDPVTGVVTTTSKTTIAAARLSERPNSRVDGGNLVDTGLIANVKDATFLGGEAAAVYGPFSVQGEYGHLRLDRRGVLPELDFDGFYAFASFFLTGESRSFKNGVVDRLKPLKDFDPAKGQWGAWEVAVRYDRLDLTDTSLSPLARKGETWTGALNWYLNPNTKLLFNYIRFKGENSPLYVLTTPVAGAGPRTAEGDIFATRLQFDF
jgi:phosphate-selective porin OprO and OprP